MHALGPLQLGFCRDAQTLLDVAVAARTAVDAWAAPELSAEHGRGAVRSVDTGPRWEEVAVATLGEPWSAVRCLALPPGLCLWRVAARTPDHFDLNAPAVGRRVQSRPGFACRVRGGGVREARARELCRRTVRVPPCFRRHGWDCGRARVEGCGAERHGPSRGAVEVSDLYRRDTCNASPTVPDGQHMRWKGTTND